MTMQENYEPQINGNRAGIDFTDRDLSVFITITVLFLLKSLLFYSLIGIAAGQIMMYASFTAAIAALCYSIILILLKRRRILAFYICHSIFTVIMFIDAVYYSYFDILPGVTAFRQASLLVQVRSSVVYLIKLQPALILADLPLLAAALLILGRRNFCWLETRRPVSFPIFVVLFLALGAGLQMGIKHVRLLPEEVFTHHIVDISEQIIGSPLEKTYPEEDLLIDNNSEGINLSGVAKGKNLIFIVAESLQSFTIGMNYEGQEITPNLNKMLRESIYFDRFYQQIGRGNTSDAEFAALNSLYPAVVEASYTRYVQNNFYGLPKILKDHGYSTLAFHANEGSFWNRDEAYRAMGFDRFLSKPDFTLNEIIGLGLSDKEFFRQSASMLGQVGNPFFSFMITLSNHHPFGLDERHRSISLKPEHEDTLYGNYLQTVHYCDAAIGDFIDRLKAEGLYDNSVICVMGDHFGLSCTDVETAAIMTDISGRPYDYDEMLRVPFIINIPEAGISMTSSITGGQIDCLPTLLNLFGMEGATVSFGNDLLNTDEGFVAQQTHILKGSFIDNDKIFIMSRDGIFANSRAYSLHTGEALDIESCRAGYERAIDEIDKSRYIMDNNLVAQILEKNADKGVLEDVGGQFRAEELIAHAGARIEGEAYTSCLESLDLSYANGYRFIEFDFCWTSDEKLVCLHDWNGSVTRLFDEQPGVYSLDEFMNFSMKGGWTQISLAELAQWLREHPDAYIVTDIKNDNLKALELIRKECPDVQRQFIPQIYNFSEYVPAEFMGYDQIILTLYRFSNAADEQILDFANLHSLLAVTMPAARGQTELPRRLKEQGVFVYCHTINKQEDKAMLVENGVDGFYTDDLLP